jgi:TMEM175 potassium channel family protein
MSLRAGEEGDPRALERLIFFSDAVFAIAMTLLVLQIPMPAVSAGPVHVLHALGDAESQIIAFGISFWVIALFWMAHHRLFRYVHSYDGTLMGLNLLLLFFVAFLPYPTAVMGTHSAYVTATVFYAIAISLTGLSSAALTRHAVRTPGLMRPAPSRRMARYLTARGLVTPAVFVATIPVAYANVDIARWMWVLTFVSQALMRRGFERREGQDRAAEEGSSSPDS